MRKPQFQETTTNIEQKKKAGVCILFVVAKGLTTDDGYSTDILSQSFIKSHCQKKYEKKRPGA